MRVMTWRALSNSPCRQPQLAGQWEVPVTPTFGSTATPTSTDTPTATCSEGQVDIARHVYTNRPSVPAHN
jgi:hypothetical protein